MKTCIRLVLMSVWFLLASQNTYAQDENLVITSRFECKGIIADSSTLEDVIDTFHVGTIQQKTLWFSKHHFHLHGKKHMHHDEHSSYYYIVKLKKYGVTFYTSSEDSLLINRITIKSKKVSTSKGIRKGLSTKQDVIAAYGPPLEDGLSLKKETILVYPEEGYIFTFHHRSPILHFFTGKRRPSKKLKGISIS